MNGPQRQSEAKSDAMIDWLQDDEPLTEAEPLSMEAGVARPSINTEGTRRTTVQVMPPMHPNDIRSPRSHSFEIDLERNPSDDVAQAEGASMSGISQSEPSSLEERIIAELRDIFDPEIPVNIYDLGLIYGVEVDESGHVDVTMTLTTPGCPVAQTFPGEVEARVGNIDGVESATVDLVWDPPWTMDMMPEDVKLQLGLF